MGELPFFIILMLWWSCCYCFAQAPSNFLSINCGLPSQPAYIDSGTGGTQWVSDAAFMAAGESYKVDSSQFSSYSSFLSTMRVFRGNDDESKYCYRLSEPYVEAGAFYLVRAWFWHGTIPPYIPQKDDTFRFKLLIDADQWTDVVVGVKNTTWKTYEMYTRALRNTIDVCLARSSPRAGADAPFISALELRPLPASLSATTLITSLNRSFIRVRHFNYGVLAGTTAFADIRYPSDFLDRIWAPINSGNDAVLSVASTTPIDTSKLGHIEDMPPAIVLQTAYGGPQNTSNHTYLYTSIIDAKNNSYYYYYYWVIYFAEIDPHVTAAGQRVFDILPNGERRTEDASLNNVDVFAQVGSNAAYEVLVGPLSASPGTSVLSLNFSASPDSLFPPLFAAAEFFLAAENASSSGTSSNDVRSIEDLKASMNLTSHTGDPCLPLGFGYPWLGCIIDNTSMETPKVTSIYLSNYALGGTISRTIRNLTMLRDVFLDGNNLLGPIPDFSSLTSLETLDLSNNKLNGSIPEYLAALEKLRFLNLENNNFSGEIPAALLAKRDATILEFKFAGNPVLCGSNIGVTYSCVPPSKKLPSNAYIIIAVVVPLVVLVVMVAGMILCICKHKSRPTSKKS